MALDTIVEESQEKNRVLYKQLKNTHGWKEDKGVWKKEGCIAIQSEDIKEEILKEHHDHPTAGQPTSANPGSSSQCCRACSKPQTLIDTAATVVWLVSQCHRLLELKDTVVTAMWQVP